MSFKMNCKSDQCSDDELYGANSNNEAQTQSSSATSNGQLNSSGAEMSKAELRKTNKPIMEKRRRARINHCLNELKMLILEAMKKDAVDKLEKRSALRKQENEPARHTKLEKADILEMTVKHLQSVQRQQWNMAIQTDPAVIQKFKTGFMECTEEVYRYIHQLEDVDAAVKQRLCNHLTNCASNLEQIGSMASFNSGYHNVGICPPADGIYDFSVNQSFFPSFSLNMPNMCAVFPNSPPEDVNNNQHSANEATVQMGNIQLIPSRLPTGEIALIMPSALNTQITSSLMKSADHTEKNVNTPSSQPLSNLTSTGQRLSAFSRPPSNRKSAAATTLPSSLLGCNVNASQSVNSSGQYLPPIEEKVLGLPTLQPSSTASPPLSPISSLCSQNEDTNVVPHSKSGPYPRPSTPIINAPISPSSSMENSSSLNNRNLQQQQVSSTSGSNNTSTSSACSENNGSISSGFISDTSGKRSYSEMSGCGSSSNGSCEDEQPLTKRCNTKELNAISQEADDQDRMWRPW